MLRRRLSGPRSALISVPQMMLRRRLSGPRSADISSTDDAQTTPLWSQISSDISSTDDAQTTPLWSQISSDISSTDDAQTTPLWSSCERWWKTNETAASQDACSTGSFRPLLSEQWYQLDRSLVQSESSGGARTCRLFTQRLQRNLTAKIYGFEWFCVLG